MRAGRRPAHETHQPAADIHVLLVEDDPYARDLMALLLTRDWRTSVVGETGDTREVLRLLAASEQPVSAVLVDGEHPTRSRWATQLAEALTDYPQIALVCTLTNPDEQRLQRLLKAGFRGCLLKSEIGYCLGDALALACKDYWVMTPGIYHLRQPFPARRAILSGRQRVADLTDLEQRVARLAIVFEQSRDDIAHELGISRDKVRQAVSQAYSKIGLHDLQSGNEVPETFFADPQLAARVKAHLQAVLPNGRGQPIQKSTLAFHLLTAAEVECHPSWKD